MTTLRHLALAFVLLTTAACDHPEPLDSLHPHLPACHFAIRCHIVNWQLGFTSGQHFACRCDDQEG